MVDVRGPPRPPVRVEAQRRFSGLTEWLAARDAVPPHASADAHFSAVLRARRFFLLDGSPGRVEKRVLGDFSAVSACSAVPLRASGLPVEGVRTRLGAGDERFLDRAR